MRRDILFFVRGLPEGFLIQDRGVFFAAPLERSLESALRTDANKIPPLKMFLDELPNAKVFCVGFRNDENHETSAVEKAWNHLMGILDGFAVVVETSSPKVCGVIQVREGEADHAKFKIY